MQQRMSRNGSRGSGPKVDYPAARFQTRRVERGKFSAHAVSLPDEAADLDIREPIEVGANARQLPLHFGIERGWVLLRIDEIRNPGEDEARRLPERFILQLPDSVH